MSKVALTPDLFRDIRDMQNRIAELEAKLSGPRMYGPFTITTTSIPASTEATFSYAHELGVIPVAVLFEQEDGVFSGRVITRIVRDVTNVTFVAYNTNPSSAAAVIYRFMILV